ncbi:hypothetical protein Cenrod_2210 [Candidatus Symbiobacter mobilis CR]|uniref:Uncharacterized protein n=1 Tax=Candidatus Symbiobacter mobilis CR TaxID=946483 RepID=U5NDF8_9BURK|nr:hypothetical protein Cenrod_2210 [Candidatus Symbiobacter mobilis CR]
MIRKAGIGNSLQNARSYLARRFRYAQHRSDGVYRRADFYDRLYRSRSPESPVTLDRNTQLGSIHVF